MQYESDLLTSQTYILRVNILGDVVWAILEE